MFLNSPKKLFLLLTLLFIILPVIAQEFTFERVDYDKIEKGIKKRKSEFFYKKLFDRFSKGDTTLTLEAKRHLYYGFSFQKKYAPYNISNFSDSLRAFDQIDTLTDNDYNSIIKYANLLLADNPFDITALNYLAYTYYNTDNEVLEQINSSKITTIFDAILSSGDGSNEESAFYVIYIAHQYSLIHALDFVYGAEQKLTANGYDYLKLDVNAYGIEGFYFDISPCMKKLNLTLDKK